MELLIMIVGLWLVVIVHMKVGDDLRKRVRKLEEKVVDLEFPLDRSDGQ